MDKTLYISDLDGTLLNSSSCISTKSLQIINSLIQKGLCFTYATARSLSSASIVTKGLNISIPVIVYNGAFIIHPKNQEIISACYFGSEEKENIHNLFRKHSLYPLVYTHCNHIEKVIYINQAINAGTSKYLSSRKNDKRMTPVKDENELYQGDIFYYTCIGDFDDLKGMHDDICNDQRYTCTFQKEIYSEEYWLEVMPRQATKANAILQLQELLGCNRVISFGDAMNDIAMFKCSHECYATKNAISDLKTIATDVIDSNDNDAVASWLSHRFQ